MKTFTSKTFILSNILTLISVKISLNHHLNCLFTGLLLLSKDHGFLKRQFGGGEKERNKSNSPKDITRSQELNLTDRKKKQNTILKFQRFSVFKYICSGNPKWRPPELLGFAKPWIHNVHLTAGCKRWRNSFCRLASFSDWCIFDITDAVGRRSLWRIMGTDEQGSVRGRYGELYSFTKWARCGVRVTWQRMKSGQPSEDTFSFFLTLSAGLAIEV